MSPPQAASGGRLIIALLLAGLAVLLWLDRRSVERGNRLFRDGDPGAAGQVYRTNEPSDRVRYNLGTALLAEGAREATTHLDAAARSPDSAVARLGSYNLSYAHLVEVDAELAPDSAIVLLRASIAAGRRAVHLDPTDDDARWNLTLGQRMLDSLTFTMRRVDREQRAGMDEIRLEDQAMTRSAEGEGEAGLEPENPQSSESIGNRTGGAVGAREAWASLDPGPISDIDARQMMSALSDDPEQLVRGLLWAHRPDVAWWNAEPYPGGDW